MHPLKRARSDPTDVPQIPNIRGDIILEVFTHKSLCAKGTVTLDEDVGDNERLSQLGERVLDATVTDYLFWRKPMLKAEDVRSRRNEILSDGNVESWIRLYRLREKLRFHPDSLSTLNTPEEAKDLFTAYVGAVYVENGYTTVHDWITRLIDQDISEEPPGREADARPPQKRVKNEMAAPEVVRTVTPALPNPLAPAQPHLPFLPLFNQTASQRRVSLEYSTIFVGPQHSGHWMAKCIVNGIEKGIGTGSSKQVAKEDSARQAYYAMGWAPSER